MHERKTTLRTNFGAVSIFSHSCAICCILLCSCHNFFIWRGVIWKSSEQCLAPTNIWALSFLFLHVRRLNKRQTLEESVHRETDTEDVRETISDWTTHTFLCLEKVCDTDLSSHYLDAHVRVGVDSAHNVQLSEWALLVDERTNLLAHLDTMNITMWY